MIQLLKLEGGRKSGWDSVTISNSVIQQILVRCLILGRVTLACRAHTPCSFLPRGPRFRKLEVHYHLALLLVPFWLPPLLPTLYSNGSKLSPCSLSLETLNLFGVGRGVMNPFVRIDKGCRPPPWRNAHVHQLLHVVPDPLQSTHARLNSPFMLVLFIDLVASIMLCAFSFWHLYQ